MINTEDLRHYTGIGTGYSPEMMMQRAADEIDGLRSTVVDLLEILQQWEPDHASAEDRHRIVKAMYQIGVLRDPTATVEAMRAACGDSTQNCNVTGAEPVGGASGGRSC